ncbi:MAG: serine protease [Bacteroidia bacterium]
MRKYLFLVLILGACHQSTLNQWAQKPINEWPSIVLVNEVQYQNGDQYISPSFTYAGSGFLIDTGKDTLAVTAKHVLWIAANKEQTGVSVNEDLASWIMRSKGSRTDSVVIDKLINEDKSEILNGPESTITERDWLVFSVSSISSGLQTLKLRKDIPLKGEKVYLLGCPYSEDDCQVYESTFVRSEDNKLLVGQPAGVNLAGASGGALIDANGHLLGVISSTTQDSVSGQDCIVAISTDYLQSVLSTNGY